MKMKILRKNILFHPSIFQKSAYCLSIAKYIINFKVSIYVRTGTGILLKAQFNVNKLYKRNYSRQTTFFILNIFKELMPEI